METGEPKIPKALQISEFGQIKVANIPREQIIFAGERQGFLAYGSVLLGSAVEVGTDGLLTEKIVEQIALYSGGGSVGIP